MEECIQYPKEKKIHKIINQGQRLTSELNSIIETDLGPLLNDPNSWETLLIDKYPPVIHRLSHKLSDERTLILHKLFHTKDEPAMMHSHSWDLAVKILKGGYEMGIGFSADRNDIPQASFVTNITDNDTYSITDENLFHYTKPINNEVSYSVMLIGKRKRERKALNNLPIPETTKIEILKEFKGLLKK